MELVFLLLFMLRGGRSSGKRDLKSSRLERTLEQRQEALVRAGSTRWKWREGLDLGRSQEAGGSVQGWKKKEGFIYNLTWWSWVPLSVWDKTPLGLRWPLSAHV